MACSSPDSKLIAIGGAIQLKETFMGLSYPTFTKVYYCKM
jgi:hypothetical protein